MTTFTLHTIETAPENAKPTLEALNQKFGFLPNIMGSMADNPVLLNGFVGSFSNFHSGSFNEAEKQILLLTNAVTLQCPYTIAVHSTFAIEDGVSREDVQRIRDGYLPGEPKFAALSTISRALIESKGHLSDAQVDAFKAAGYSQSQVFEVVLSFGISTLTATTANLAGTPVDSHFQENVWSPA